MVKKCNKVLYWGGGPLPVKLVYAPNAKAWKRALKQMAIPDEPYPESAGRCTIYDSSKYPEVICIVTINPTDKTEKCQIVGLIAHEATHVMQAVMEHMHPGYEVQRHDEAEAYIVQWATQAIFSGFEDYQKEIAK